MTKMNNKGFLLAESLIVSTFVLTVLIFLFIQFRSIMISNKRTYTYNSIEDIYSLGSVSDYYKNNPDVLDNLKGQINESNKYIYIYKDNETNPLCSGTCHRIAEAGALEYIIYTDSNIETIRGALNNDQAAEDLRTFVRKIDTQMVEGMGRLIGKYKNGNFATVVLNTNIKNRKPIIKSWGENENTDFHAENYRKNITKVFFENKISLQNAAAYWDVSANPNEPVIAWVTRENQYSPHFHLHIGGKGGVTANADSSNLFEYFPILNEIAFNNNFDTSNAVNMKRMFAGGNAITSIDVSSFDTKNVTSMYGMFSAWDTNIGSSGDWGSRTITEIKGLENFNTENVTTLGDMFSGQPIKNLDLSNFNTSNVQNMFHMFNGCNKVVSINISNWDTSKVTNMQGMFQECTELKKIYANSSFVTTNVTLSGSMFYKNTKIVGGNGTTFDSNKINKEYARIDGTSKGYFTKIEEKDDSAVPTDSLIFWGVSKNAVNTQAVLKNKAPAKTGVLGNGTLKNFNNNTSSGFNGEDLIFDGANDYVEIASSPNYDFTKKQTIILYAKINNISGFQALIGNWENAGCGIEKNNDNQFQYAVYASGYKIAKTGTIQAGKYYYIVGVFNGSTVNVYLDGQKIGSGVAATDLTKTSMPILIGANPNSSTSSYSTSSYAKMSLREAMIYKRAISAAEITAIHNYLKAKYPTN